MIILLFISLVIAGGLILYMERQRRKRSGVIRARKKDRLERLTRMLETTGNKK